MREFRKVRSMSQNWLFVWKSPWKCLHVGRGGVSGNHLGRMVVPAHLMGTQHGGRQRLQPGWGGPSKGTAASASTSAWKEAASPAPALKPDNGPSLCGPDTFRAAAPALEPRRASPSVVSLRGPFKRTPGTPASPYVTRTPFLLVFTARSCGDSSSRHWNSGLGSLVWTWDPLLLYS